MVLQVLMQPHMMQKELGRSRWRAEVQNPLPSEVAARWSWSLSLNTPLMLRFASHAERQIYQIHPCFSR